MNIEAIGVLIKYTHTSKTLVEMAYLKYTVLLKQKISLMPIYLCTDTLKSL